MQKLKISPRTSMKIVQPSENKFSLVYKIQIKLIFPFQDGVKKPTVVPGQQCCLFWWGWQTITMRVYHIYPHGHCLPPDGAMHKSPPCKSPGGSQKILFYTLRPSIMSQCLHFGWLKSVKEHFLTTTRTFAWRGLTHGAIWW